MGFQKEEEGENGETLFSGSFVFSASVLHFQSLCLCLTPDRRESSLLSARAV